MDSAAPETRPSGNDGLAYALHELARLYLDLFDHARTPKPQKDILDLILTIDLYTANWNDLTPTQPRDLDDTYRNLHRLSRHTEHLYNIETQLRRITRYVRTQLNDHAHTTCLPIPCPHCSTHLYLYDLYIRCPGCGRIWYEADWPSIVAMLTGPVITLDRETRNDR